MTMMLLLLFVLYILNLSTAADVGDSCTPSNEISEGTCTLYTKCEVAIRLVKNKGYHNFQRCGFSGNIEIMCCPVFDKVIKFGDPQATSEAGRIADRECQKIINSTPPPLNQYIIGGEEASIGEFPHMVALGYDREDNGVYSFDCGGTLISERYVLSAAHCFRRTEPTIARVGMVELGAKTWNSETDYRIAGVRVHENYSYPQVYNDLALVRLQTAVSFNTVANAACLYTKSEDPTVSLTISGWGTTNVTRDTRSDFLLKANVTVVPNRSCNAQFSARDTGMKLTRGITEQQICAGHPAGQTDTCKGDSGGPLQGLTASDSHYRVIGVTSYGIGCGNTIPGVYIRVSAYLDWIVKHVWQS